MSDEVNGIRLICCKEFFMTYLSNHQRSSLSPLRCIQHIPFVFALVFLTVKSKRSVTLTFSPTDVTQVYWRINQGDITSMCPWRCRRWIDVKISHMFREGEQRFSVCPDIQFNSLIYCTGIIQLSTTLIDLVNHSLGSLLDCNSPKCVQ